MRRYARTREKEYGWKLATWSLGGSLVCAPLVSLLFEGWRGLRFSEVRKSISREAVKATKLQKTCEFGEGESEEESWGLIHPDLDSLDLQHRP